MAEIDRIKALAGLLDDDEDDDLLFSSSGESTNEDPAGESVAAASNGSSSHRQNKMLSGQFRHGVEKNQQQDNILMEMQQRKKIVRNEPSAPQTTPLQHSKNTPTKTINKSPTRSKLGQPRLTIRTDPAPTTNESESTDEKLIFGRPQTFGAAGGFDEDYMPNVKERAVAISAWKILEMKKEKKNGHARAREWAMRDQEGGDCGGEMEQGEEEENDENVNGNGRELMPKKSKIPSFLAQFDDGDDENNSVTCVASTPTTPRGEKRVPLSPRSFNTGVLSPERLAGVVSPRDIGVGPRNVMSPKMGIGVSPRNGVMSPRSDALLSASKASGGRRSIDRKLKVNTLSSPKNKIMSPRNQVMSPRTNALLSPSKAPGKSVKHLNGNNKPPMSPRGIVNKGANPSFNKSEDSSVIVDQVKSDNNVIKSTAVKPAEKSAPAFKSNIRHDRPQAVKFNGVEVIGELASKLQLRFDKSGTPESPVANNGIENGIESNGAAVGLENVDENQNNVDGRSNSTVHKNVCELSPAENKAVNGRILHDPMNKGYRIQEKTESIEIGSTIEKQDPINDIPAPSANNKTIMETLEEASNLLQTEFHDDIIVKKGSSSDSIDSMVDDELAAAEELARALDKLLVLSDSSTSVDVDGDYSDGVENAVENECVYVESSSRVGNSGSGMMPKYLKEQHRDTMRAELVHEEKESVNEVNRNEASEFSEAANEKLQLDQWNLSGQRENVNNDHFAFPSDFEGFTCSQLDDVTFQASNSNDSLLGANLDLAESSKRSTTKGRVLDGKIRPKVRVNLKIDGAPTLDIKKSDDESMFFVSRPSPTCGDNAGLLKTEQHSFSSSKAPKASSLVIKPRDTPKKRGVALNSPTRKRLNNLGLKLGLINNAVPSKNEQDKNADSPSMAGLLLENEDENVRFVSNSELRELTPTHQQSGHFFESPSSPIIYGSLVAGSLNQKNAKVGSADFGSGRKKKATKFLQVIASPLLGRKTLRTELSDDASFGEV